MIFFWSFKSRTGRVDIMDIILRFFSLALWFFLFVLLLYLSVSDLDGSVAFFPNVDKVYHAGYYFVLAILWAYSARKNWIIAAGCLFMFFSGVLIESVQYYLPARSFSFADMMANTFGLVLGSFVFISIKKNVKKSWIFTLLFRGSRSFSSDS